MSAVTLCLLFPTCLISLYPEVEDMDTAYMQRAVNISDLGLEVA